MPEANDTTGISLKTSQEVFVDMGEVAFNLQNLSEKHIEVAASRDSDVLYTKTNAGWMPSGPCPETVALGSEAHSISPETTLDYGVPYCGWLWVRYAAPSVYMLSKRYRLANVQTEGWSLVLYSNEFQVGEAEPVDSFAVTIENSTIASFSLHNHLGQSIWLNPPCSTQEDPLQGTAFVEAAYVLQRQIDLNAWEYFFFDEERCVESTEPLEIEADDSITTTNYMPILTRAQELPAGCYRWKVVYFTRWDLTDIMLNSAISDRRHLFGPIFQYDGESRQP